MWERALISRKKAVTVILAVSVVMGFLASFPQCQKSLGESYASQVGKLMEPALKPLRFDWRIGIGLLSTQAAPEAMMSTLATIYGEDNPEPSGAQM